MDHIYPTKDYKVYKIKDEVEKLRNSVLSSGMPTSFNDISRAAGISEERLKTISLEVCNSYQDYGNAEPGDAPAPFKAFSNDAMELKCVKALREGNFEFKEPRVKDFVKFKEKPESAAQVQEDMEAYSDSVITVRFYEPFVYTPSMKNHPRFHLEYQVLGSNFLTDLRDIFYCHSNFGPFDDISEDPHKEQDYEPDTPDPGFFFVHDVFYNDTRIPQNPDYSETILNWYQRYDYVREFKTGIMQDTKFEDLEIRVGYPNLYQHQGNCEHIFCITSVDLLDNSSSLVRSDYPILSSSSKKRSTLCDICGQTDVSYLVTNCGIHVKDPMKVCYSCFFGFHYASDGITKVCGFNAYRLYSVRPEN